MAVDKPEIRMSQLLDMIATPFQRLTPIIGVQELNGAWPNIVLFASGLTAAILNFRIPVTLDGIENSAIEFLDPENGD